MLVRAFARLSLVAFVLAILITPGTPATAATAIGTAKYIFADGFDTCDTPSDTTLYNFWNETPVYFAGLYLGGADGEAVGCDDIGVAKWDYASSIGYGIAPFWYAWQMPISCGGQTDRPYYIPLDPSSAYSEGASVALNAASAANAHGLDPGDIIYLDVEGYSGYTKSSCFTAELNYAEGWDDEMNSTTQYAPGIYGSACSSALQQLYNNLTELPNAIAPSDTSRDPTGVYGLACLGDSAWNGDKRIHQFSTGDDVSFNGSKMRVDEDCADGRLDTNYCRVNEVL